MYNESVEKCTSLL